MYSATAAGKRKKSMSSNSSKSSKSSESSKSSKSSESLCSNKDSLFNCCTPIERGERCVVKKQHHKRRAKSAIIKSVTIPNIKVFLETRKSIFTLPIQPIQETYIDCLDINKKGFFINKEKITGTNNIKIEGYLSNGCYGSIFIASHEGTNKYVIKFMVAHSNNINEIRTMIDIKDKLKSDLFPIPNFLYMAYYYHKCNKLTIDPSIKHTINSTISITSRNIIDDIESNITTDYSLLVLEYFDDTIYKLLSNINASPKSIALKEEYFKSIFSQMIISLYILHNKFNYIHNDTHLNNFLYKTVEEENNYFHYKINDKDYYIKNCGYLVVLADYGLCKEISTYESPEKNRKIFKDYSCTISQILINIPNIQTINPSFFTNYIEKIKFYNVDEVYTSLDENVFLDTILTCCLNIATDKTDNMKLINTEPYK